MTAVALTTKTQEAVDRFYVQQGPCCAGCDWWHHHNSLVGECHRSAPVSAEERYGMVRMDWHTFRLSTPDAGHILTNREHLCGDFKDGFDWPSLPPPYLRRIGWDGSTHGPNGSPLRHRQRPDGQDGQDGISAVKDLSASASPATKEQQ